MRWLLAILGSLVIFSLYVLFSGITPEDAESSSRDTFADIIPVDFTGDLTNQEVGEDQKAEYTDDDQPPDESPGASDTAVVPLQEWDASPIPAEHPPEPPTALETTHICKGFTNYNQTCIFRNAYYIPGFDPPIFQLVVGGRQLAEPKLDPWGGENFFSGHRVSVRRYKTVEELEKTLAPHNVKRFKGLSVYVKLRYHQNWAHSQFDGTYPAFAAMAKFGRHTEPFLALVSAPECKASKTSSNCPADPENLEIWGHLDPCWRYEKTNGGCRNKAALASFSHFSDPAGDFLRQSKMELDKNQWYVFDELIMGSMHAGQKQSGYTLPWSVDMPYWPKDKGKTVIKAFRDRWYKAFGVNMPKRNKSSDARPARLKVLITDNVRFDDQQRRILHEVAEECSRTCSNVQVDFMKWRDYPTFRDQIRLFSTVDIYLTGPGTGIFYALLMPDGAVTINTGTANPSFVKPHPGLPTYGQEEWIGMSNPQARLITIPIDKVWKGIGKSDYLAAIEKAAALIRSGYPIPFTRPEEDLSPFGRIVKYLHDNVRVNGLVLENEWMELNSRMFKHPDGLDMTRHCSRKAWSLLVFETERAKRCQLDEPLLRKLKKEYRLREAMGLSPETKCECVICKECQ